MKILLRCIAGTSFIFLVLYLSLIFLNYKDAKQSEKFAESIVVQYIQNKNSQYYIDNAVFTNDDVNLTKIKTNLNAILNNNTNLSSYTLSKKKIGKSGFDYSFTRRKFSRTYPKAHFNYILNFEGVKNERVLSISVVKKRHGWKSYSMQILNIKD